jgi:hypothetical protein
VERTLLLPRIDPYDDWLYWSDTHAQFLPLPPWAIFFLALGEAIASLPEDSGRSVTAVAVPSLGYAGALSAVGFHIGIAVERPLEEHIQLLRSLPAGRQVWFNKTTKRIKGALEGIFPSATGEVIKMTFKRGKEIWSETITIEDAMRVQLASKDGPVKRAGFLEKAPIGEFASQVLGPAVSRDIHLRSSIESVLVGQKNPLRVEATETLFAISRNELTANGTLQQLLRTIEFGDSKDTHGYASRIETPYEDSAAHLEARGLVVFNGERAFSIGHPRHGNVRHWVVVLDRTNRRFIEACDILDGMFIDREGLVDLGALPTPPEGVELSSFLRES